MIVTFIGHIPYTNVNFFVIPVPTYVHQLDIQSVKVWCRCNKIRGRSITCSYIEHVNTSKCMYKLDTHSVWWRYMLSNTHAGHLCDIFFSDIGQCYPPTQKKAGHVNTLSGIGCWQATDCNRQNSKITDRQTFLILSNSCLYMVHLGLGPFFLEVAKLVGA